MDSTDPREEKKENFVLDVRITEVINTRAFRAVLENGHTLVAYLPRLRHGPASVELNVGDDAQVRLSPFDMSRGELIFPREVGHHEG